jgi:hypothetical protein|tara:strand:+ start:2065 stop:2211 length:147 start_codon:yes stop_codon:yes gene_type:complete
MMDPRFSVVTIDMSGNPPCFLNALLAGEHRIVHPANGRLPRGQSLIFE